VTIPYVSAYDECPHVQYDETAAGTFRGSEAAEAQAKRLDLLNKLVTAAGSIGVLANPKFRNTDRQLHELQDAAAGLKRRLQILRASNSDEIDAASPRPLTNGWPGSSLFQTFFARQRKQLVALAARFEDVKSPTGVVVPLGRVRLFPS